MKKIYYIVVFIFSFLGMQAQMQTAHWYFGANAGVDFSSGSPVAVTDGALVTAEGSSGISDEFGNLLFYTDGRTVYTGSHTIMPNGEELYGSSSSSQSALIVPGPGISNVFYIFTTDAIEVSPKHGFNYTVVDMALGTEGEVVTAQKNIPVPLGGDQNVSEKVAAVAKSDCSGYWIITYNKNKFYVFSLTEDGLDIDNPVIIDSAPFSNENSNDDGIQGYIKVSPDGKKLAAAFKKDYTGSLVLYDFDSSNGNISNGGVLSAPDPMNGGRLYYSVEFSPDSKILYAAYSGLVRYDLTAASIPDSEIVFYSTGNGVSGTLQLGLDGKMYYSRLNNSNYLAVINDPNNFAAPGLNLFGVFLAGKLHAIGLPTFPQPFYNANLYVNGSQDVQTFCAEEPVNFSYCFSGGVLPDWTVKYDFGDGTTSNDENPVHSYTDAGTYTVTLEITIGLNVITVRNTVIIVPLPIANGPADLVMCDVLPNDGFSQFDLALRTAAILGGQDSGAYTVTYHLTEDAAIANEDIQPLSFNNTANPQTIYARVTNIATGCYDTTSFGLIVNPVPVITDPDDLLACEDEQGGGIGVFDLTQAIPQITGGDTALAVTFYKDLGDLGNNIPVVSPATYANTIPYSDTVYFKAVYPGAPNCSDTGELGLTVNPLYDLNDDITDLILCDYNDTGDGFEFFDLTVKYNEITNQPGLSLGYFYEQAGEFVAIADPTAFRNTVAGGQIIFVSTSGQFTCSNTTNFTIKVSPLPAIENHGPFYACEDEPGLGKFNLQDITAALINGQPNLSVSYYATEGQAQGGNDINMLPSPYPSANGTIYSRVSNTVTGCTIVVPVLLEVIPGPVATPPAPLHECDPNNNNVTSFNLDPVLELIEVQLGGTVNATPFETYDDAFFNALNNDIENTSIYENVVAYTTNGVQILFIRVDSELTDCFDIVELQLIVHPVPEVTEPEPYEMCDNGTNDTDGIAIFDLTTLEEGILNGQDATQYTVAFYDGFGLIATPANYPSASATIKARVTNNATGCFKEVDVALIVNPLPVANDPEPYTLCDSNAPGDEREVFDLTTKTEEIIGSQDGINVTFFHNYNDALAGTGPSRIMNPDAYTNTQAVETLFVRVTVEETGCYRIVLLDVRVEPIPVLVMPTAEELTVCDTTGLGIGVFDLSALIENMVNGATDLEVSFHTTYQDAIGGNNPITEDLANYHNVNPFAQFLYVRVVNSTTGCTRLEPYVLSLVVEPAPQAPEHLEDLVQCDDRDANGQDNKAYFDLTRQDAVIHAALGSTPDTMTIHYFVSEANANNGAPRITNPAHYYGTGGQTIWVRVGTPVTGCFSVTSFGLILDKSLLLTTPTILALCNESLEPGGNDGQTQFDLTVKDEEILGPFGIGQGMTVNYFETDPRVDLTAMPVVDATAYTNPPPPQGNPKTLYVTVTTPQGCKSYTTLTLKVLPLPVPDKEAGPLVLCDDNNSPDGEELFNLTDAAADIRNGDVTMMLTYYTTAADAHNRENSIPVSTAHNSGSATIWVRAEANTGNAADPVCYQVVSFELIVNMLPELGEAGVITPYAICEQNTDGIATFNFNTHMDEILGEGINPVDYTITFHRTEADRLAGIAMPYIYTNTSSPNIQNIIVQVINKDTGCTNWAPLTLLVEEAAIANPVGETFFECDYNGTNDGVFTFDLTHADDDALGTQNPADYSVTYYTSPEDAEAGDNAIANPTAFQNTPEYQMLWVRVTNEATVSGCYEVTTLELFVERIPEPGLEGGTICVDFRTQEVLRDHPMDSGLDATHTFVWYHNGQVIPGATGPTYSATEAGEYTVIATSATGCVSDPIAAVTVERSGPASPIGKGYVVSNAFSDGQTIVVLAEGYGEYQYQLDDGPWQNSNVFNNVSAGPHEVHIRDIATDNPCDEFNLLLENVSVIDYPNFFTPNGDSYHDTWNIFGLDTDENRDAKIHIFDRYGKLLKQISAAGAGWDGTYNGQPMPGDDYWFTVAYTFNGEAREFKAHFALKR